MTSSFVCSIIAHFQQCALLQWQHRYRKHYNECRINAAAEASYDRIRSLSLYFTSIFAVILFILTIGVQCTVYTCVATEPRYMYYDARLKSDVRFGLGTFGFRGCHSTKPPPHDLSGGFTRWRCPCSFVSFSVAWNAYCWRRGLIASAIPTA